jgi:hypothetical protein
MSFRARLEKYDVDLRHWITRFQEQAGALRDENGALDPAQTRLFLTTAKRLALRIGQNLPPELSPEALAESRRIILEGVAKLDDFDDDRPLDFLDDFLLRAEAVRHFIRDALDEERGDDGSDAQTLVEGLTTWLTDINQVDLAALVGVDPKTLQRWRSKSPPPSARVRLVYRLVSVLRRAWTPRGVVAWFYRPRLDLDGKAPIEVIDDPEYEPALLDAARQGRAQHG